MFIMDISGGQNEKIKMCKFFAGVGGIDLGFSEFCDTIYANENDANAVITFK